MDFDKKLFIKLFYDAYVSRYMTTNIYLHIEFFKCLKKICKEKKTDRVIESYDKFKKILYHNNVHFIELPAHDELSDSDISRIVSACNEDYPVLAQLKPPVLNEKIHSLLNHVYGCILRSEVAKCTEVLSCIAYMAGLKNKDIGNVGNVSIIDILFNIITHLSKVMDPHMHRYVLVSRELMYFRSNKNILRERIRLLHGTVYVMLMNKMDKSRLIIPKQRDAVLDYLYVICDKDYHAMREIESAMEKIRAQRVPDKKVHVDQSIAGHLASVESTNIVKMSAY